MATPEEINAQNQTGDFERRLKKLENEWQLALDNLLEPALMLPGTLRFGGNIMQLNNSGIQIQTPTPASADVPAIYWVNSLNPIPGAVEPRVALSGRADPSTATFPNGIFTYRLEAVNGTRYARIRHNVVADGSAANLMEFSHDGASTEAEYGQFYLPGAPGITFHRFLGGDYVQFHRLPLFLADLTDTYTDPASPENGMVWYDHVAEKLKARINGATIPLGGTAITNQTGTYSAVVGDFVRCSGTFTVTLPSAPANNSEVWVKNAGTGTITVARGGSDTMFVFTSGLTTVTLAPGEALGFKYYATGTEWSVF